MNWQQELHSNLHEVKARIHSACQRVNRDPSEIKLLLATKTVSPEKIVVALQAGETLLGENKVQELKEKFEALKTIPHESHFIGHLQTNKIKEVLRYADCIQSVDRWDLAEKLQKRLEFENRKIDVFIQVNTSFEESKFGIAPEEAVHFALQVKQLDRLNIKGLMTIGLFSSEEDKVRPCFQRLFQLQCEMKNLGIPVADLSMGMSHDFEIAIEEGATLIRVGTSIFGKRQYPDSYYWNEATP